jgi:hypothetical protein
VRSQCLDQGIDITLGRGGYSWDIFQAASCSGDDGKRGGKRFEQGPRLVLDPCGKGDDPDAGPIR